MLLSVVVVWGWTFVLVKDAVAVYGVIPFLAVRFAIHMNGVSVLHAAVSRRMWHELFPGVPEREVPFVSITNGVHRSWVAPAVRDLLESHLGTDLSSVPPEQITKCGQGSEHLDTDHEGLSDYVESWDGVRCAVMQGGQGEVKHWAFNDPPKREAPYTDAPPPPEEYRKLSTRLVDLHPMTLIQNARTSGGGVVQNVPTRAVTVGPVQTWQAEKVSIWHPGHHDNPFGIRLTALMISKQVPDSAVPMSLLADHPNVQFNYLRPGIGTCNVEMH
jgi:hypothetical protein